MKEVLQHIYDYRDLRARRDLLRMPLAAGDARRLEALEKLLGAGAGKPSAFAKDDERRRFTRIEVDISGSIDVGFGMSQEVRVLNISGGGLVVAPSTRLVRGDLTIVTVRDDESGKSYHLPSQVMWTSEECQGLCFIGVPGIPPARS